MSEKTDPTVEFDDTMLQLKYLRYRDLLGQLKQVEKEIATLKAEFQVAMGDAHVAKIDGEEVFTWRPINKFATTQFKAEHPNLAKEFTRPVVKDELDIEALRAEHPYLFDQYRVRQFNTKEV